MPHDWSYYHCGHRGPLNKDASLALCPACSLRRGRCDCEACRAFRQTREEVERVSRANARSEWDRQHPGWLRVADDWDQAVCCSQCGMPAAEYVAPPPGGEENALCLPCAEALKLNYGRRPYSD